jgi:hypothetical protein
VGRPHGEIRGTATTQDTLQGFADTIEFLAGECGHSLEAIWRMTPRQLTGYMRLAKKRFERSAKS